jgi:hypothetical protein
VLLLLLLLLPLLANQTTATKVLASWRARAGLGAVQTRPLLKRNDATSVLLLFGVHSLR